MGHDMAKQLFDQGMPADELAARAVAGIQRGDFVIVTHAHSRKFAAERCQEVLGAFDREALPGADDRYDIDMIVNRMIADLLAGGRARPERAAQRSGAAVTTREIGRAGALGAA
jgi:hypothetical protein